MTDPSQLRSWADRLACVPWDDLRDVDRVVEEMRAAADEEDGRVAE